jgi:spore germination protein YaaH
VRRVALAAVLVTVMTACSAIPGESVSQPPTTSNVSTTTSTTVEVPTATVAADPSTTTTSTAPVPVVTLLLAAPEALAASRGVTVLVETSDGVRLGELATDEPLGVPVPMGTALRFVYLAPDGSPTDVVWEQTVQSQEVVVVQQWRAPDVPAGDIVLVWQSLGDTAAYVRQLDAAPGVTVVSPVWWYVRADGTISDQSTRAYVDAVHDRSVDIWPAVAGLDADANHELLSDPARRSEAAVVIADRAQAIGADGVNIDIEGYREEDAADFLLFARELTDLVHAWGGVVSYDLIPRSDSWDVSPSDLAFWSTAPPRREIAAIVDYTVLMAYDQHNRYRPAGPVASPNWVEDALVYALRYVDPDRLILGLPFYGRVWDPDQIDKPKARGVATIAALAESGEATFDEEFGMDRVTLDDGRFLWREDPALLADRLALVDDFGLAGWAAWRLGFDSPDLWETLGAG